MSPTFVQVMLLRPQNYPEKNLKLLTQFPAVPRVGEWVEWGAMSRRVVGVEYRSLADDDSHFGAVVYLEDAPLQEHPRRHPGWAKQGD